MEESEPRRRRRADDLNERISDVENQVEALRMLPERVSSLRDAVEAMRTTMRDMAQVEDQRITDLRADVREINAAVLKMDRHNGKLHEQTRKVAATAPVISWDAVAKFAAIVAALLVPILVALIGLHS